MWGMHVQCDPSLQENRPRKEASWRSQTNNRAELNTFPTAEQEKKKTPVMFWHGEKRSRRVWDCRNPAVDWRFSSRLAALASRQESLFGASFSKSLWTRVWRGRCVSLPGVWQRRLDVLVSTFVNDGRMDNRSTADRKPREQISLWLFTFRKLMILDLFFLSRCRKVSQHNFVWKNSLDLDVLSFNINLIKWRVPLVIHRLHMIQTAHYMAIIILIDMG